MSKPLRCLLVDDNPDDRALVLRELRREFPDLEALEITRATELDLGLKSNFDFVITDYQLRWTDGSIVLKTVKKLRPDCPVIMFTGTGSEEIAVAAMKAGLDDYVLKSPKHYVRVVAAVHSTLDRVKSERRAASLELRLESLMNRLHVGVFRAAADGSILEANPAFLHLLGLSSTEGANLYQLFFERTDGARSQERLTAGGHLQEHQVRLRRADGHPLWVSLTQTLSKISEEEMVIDGLVEDITQQLKLEMELRQSQKMESIGQLAAGLAHDFNNILTIIQGYAMVVLAEPELRPDWRLSLEQVSAAADRAAALTRQLLTFSRKQLMQLQILDLNEFLGSIGKSMQATLGDDIAFEAVLGSGVSLVQADPTMIEQMLTNLADNARDAMPHGGRFMITTSEIEIDAAHPRDHADARPGRFVRLKVTDTGVGMDALVQGHLFEPFFTTKEVGKGSGLGLAAVYGIVKQHLGWIEVASQPGRGTSFQIFLPVRVHVVEAAEPAKNVNPHGHEMILVVEDEPALRELVCEILKTYGYEVVHAGSGPEALEVWKPLTDKIDLLLTDMKMPDMDGMELARQLCAAKPNLKVLYTSGYTVDLVEPDFRLRQGLRFLQKPYQPEALVEAVRSCLDD